jgi:hypothetical protein
MIGQACPFLVKQENAVRSPGPGSMTSRSENAAIAENVGRQISDMPAFAISQHLDASIIANSVRFDTSRSHNRVHHIVKGTSSDLQQI